MQDGNAMQVHVSSMERAVAGQEKIIEANRFYKLL